MPQPLPLPAIPARIMVAPMGGGPTTPELVAAAGSAGALGFLAAGYRTPDAVRESIAAVKRISDDPFGVNVFAPPVVDTREQQKVAAYVDLLRPLAQGLGVEPGAPVHGDDDYAAKVEAVLELRPAIVSFTFGLPDAAVMSEFRRRGIPVAVTVTDPDQAEIAENGGADCLIAQGWEAGAHRGGFDDTSDLALLPLLRLIATRTALPIVAAGGLADGAAVAGVLAAGATAAMLGTAFLRCPEAGTSPRHAAALQRRHPTAMTRAFTGRNARGLTNRFMADFSASAPAAYPEVHYATSPIRSAAREVGDLERLHLWAGQAHELAADLPAADLVRRLRDDATSALRAAIEQVTPHDGDPL